MEFTIILFLVILSSLCWGSFLASLAYRISYDKSLFTKRSYCPHCKNTIAWYDNIPVISWILLKRKCRNCNQPISFIYPFIELTTASTLTFLFLHFHKMYYSHFSFAALKTFTTAQPLLSFIIYAFFFSALILATATDLQAFVVPQCATIWLIPLGFLCATLKIINISFLESFWGAFIGYVSLWLTATLFKYFTKKNGLGVGDMEMLAMIGSFLGPLGVWISLLIGTFSGLILGGIFLLVIKKDRSARIPFGPFLALGALLFFFFDDTLINLLI